MTIFSNVHAFGIKSGSQRPIDRHSMLFLCLVQFCCCFFIFWFIFKKSANDWTFFLLSSNRAASN